MTEASGLNHAGWRNAITAAAVEARQGAEPIEGPVSVDAEFRFTMPKSRPKGTRLIGLSWRTVAPDLDKLQRALGDALEAAQLIRSDDLIAEWHARKIEVADSWSGLTVIIRELSMPTFATEELPRVPHLSLVET